jgi:hypothetical protein
MTPTTVSRLVWSAHVRTLASLGRDPFDGRGASRLLAFAWDLADLARPTLGTGIRLQPLRLTYGERQVRRYIPYFTDAGLLVMTVKNSRGMYGQPGRAAQYGLTVRPDHCPAGRTDVGSEDAPLSGQCCAQHAALSVARDAPSLSTTLPSSEHETVSRIDTHAHSRATYGGGR